MKKKRGAKNKIKNKKIKKIKKNLRINATP
jgi:hypothetical protein